MARNESSLDFDIFELANAGMGDARWERLKAVCPNWYAALRMLLYGVGSRNEKSGGDS